MKNNKIIRRLGCVCLILLLLFAMLCSTPVSATGVAEITFGEVMAKSGDEVVVPVTIENNPGIATFRFRVSYDMEGMEFVSVTKGFVLTDGTLSSMTDPESKTVTFLWFSTTNVEGDGEIAQLKFRIQGDAYGSYPLSVTYLDEDLLNDSLDKIPYNVVEGKVDVVVPVINVTVDKNAITLDTGNNNTATLIAAVFPENATEKTVMWNSSDETVATVMGGVVTAINHGTAVITAKTVDGNFTAVCLVTVLCAHTAKIATAAKTANCQEDGWDAYYTCEDCGQLLASDGITKISSIPKINKDTSNHTDIRFFAADTATCVHKGHDAYKKCVDCGVITEGSDVKYFGDHNYGKLIAAVAEKHTTSKLSPAVAAHYNCSVCDKFFTEGKVETTLAELTGPTPTHIYDNSCDAECNVCHVTRETSHSYNGDHICDVCGYKNIDISKIFPDTSNNAWYSDAVAYAYSSGILKGYANGKFGTSDGIQRQDFLAMLARYDGADLSLYEDMHGEFKDVGRNAYYESSVNWGKANNIVSGYNDGRFGVGDKITREQIVTFLWRYAQYKGLDVSVSDASKRAIKNQYKDFGKVSTFSQDAVLWALDRGVIGGKDPQTIAPQGNAQRCEVAQIMYNIFNKDIF